MITPGLCPGSWFSPAKAARAGKTLAHNSPQLPKDRSEAWKARDFPQPVNASGLGRMASRTLKVLDDGDVSAVADTYHAWRELGGSYDDVLGFARSASLAEIATQGFVLNPGRYVGSVAELESDEPFDIRMQRLTGELQAQMSEGVELDIRIRDQLASIGF